MKNAILLGLILSLVICLTPAQAAPVVYNLTSDGDVITGTITFDTDFAPDSTDGTEDEYVWSKGDGPESMNPAIVAAAFNVATVPETFDTTAATMKLVMTLTMSTADDTPLTLNLDSDWADAGPYLYTVQTLDFATGNGAIDNPYGADITGAALTPPPPPAPVDWDNIGDGGTTVVNYEELLIGRLEVFNSSTLLIEDGAVITQDPGQDSYIGGDGGSTGLGTVIHTGGSFAHGDDLKCTDGGPAVYKVQGGTCTIPGYLETDGDCLFEFSGGSFICGVEDEEAVRDSGATFRVIGNGASLIQFDAIEGSAAKYEFVPNAAGGITPITSGDTQGDTLNVNLDALTAPATMTLFTGGWVDVFDAADVTITQGATTLTPGTAGSLGLNEYSLDYLGGTGLALSVNVEGTSPVESTSHVESWDLYR